MRILHTSDWHIGRQFHGISLLDDQRHALNHLLRIVRDERVDVVVVAGDIYDRAVPPAEAVELLDEVLHALAYDCGVPVILIAGNHDSPERLGFGARQLACGGGQALTQQFRDCSPPGRCCVLMANRFFYGYVGNGARVSMGGCSLNLEVSRT